MKKGDPAETSVLSLIHAQVIYVVDGSAPEKIGPATIDLIELLAHPALQADQSLRDGRC